MTRLPTIDRKRKWLAFAAGYAGFCALYMLTGRIHLRSASPAPMLAIDGLIPFVDWTVWIYHSQFFFLLFAVWALETEAIISRTFYSMGLASALSFCVFFIYPTELTRPSIETAGATTQAFQFLYAIDTATNCLPSLHTALAGLGAFGVADERAREAIFAASWAGLITLSTMTTKQHYLIDVLAGLIVAVGCRAIAKRLRLKAL